MIKTLTISLTGLALITISSCNQAPKPLKYNIDRDKNIQHIERSFELYKEHKGHKAMAVALDKEGKYVLGYSYDCASIQSARKIALAHCQSANIRAEVKAHVRCQIFAEENNIVRALQ